MADRGILFSAPMVQALLAGRKTQTRRLIKPVDRAARTGDIIVSWPAGAAVRTGLTFGPPYQTDDRLWVRENFRAESNDRDYSGYRYLADDAWHGIENTQEAADRWLDWFHYHKGPADRMAGRGKTVPAIHMPRWASRLWLQVTDVRVQPLQETSREDCVAEGHPRADDKWKLDEEVHLDAARDWYMDLWGTLHTKPGERWADNPWVVAVTFDVHRRNIDA